MAMLLLAVGVVAAVQHYRATLRGSAERLAQAMLQAEDRQQVMAERLHEAEAALAAAPRPTASQAESGDTGPAQRLNRAAADLERLAAAIAANTHRPALSGPALTLDLQRALESLARDAMRLPTMRHRPPPGVPAAPVLLHGSDLGALLRRARDAAALGDLALVHYLLADARRLLGWYRQEPRALALAARIEQLRDRLHADPDPGARLRRLAAELRAVATQWPAADLPQPAHVATGPLPGAGPAPVPSSRAQR